MNYEDFRTELFKMWFDLCVNAGEDFEDFNYREGRGCIFDFCGSDFHNGNKIGFFIGGVDGDYTFMCELPTEVTVNLAEAYRIAKGSTSDALKTLECRANEDGQWFIASLNFISLTAEEMQQAVSDLIRFSTFLMMLDDLRNGVKLSA